MFSMDTLQIVAEPRRREILRLVWDHELTAGDIARQVDVGFSAVSQHLGVLRDAGFVQVRRDGKHRYYQADFRGLGTLKDVLERLWSEHIDRLAVLAEQAEQAQQPGGAPRR
jgi:DNA-binding transcriptional ArsR family regulator